MYDDLISALREDAEWAEANEWETPITLSDHLEIAADAIEELQKLLDGVESDNDSLCKTIDLYRELLGGHPDPRGEDGEPGVKCFECKSFDYDGI